MFQDSESLVLDSGAACHIVPLRYASDYPLQPLTDDMQRFRLMTAGGTEIVKRGRREVFYELLPGTIALR